MNRAQRELIESLSRVPIPTHTVGTCRNAYKCSDCHKKSKSGASCSHAYRCRQTNVDLGNGLCVKCWDRTIAHSPKDQREKDNAMQQ